MEFGKYYLIYNYSDDAYFDRIKDNEVNWQQDPDDAWRFTSLAEARKFFNLLKKDWAVQLLEVSVKTIE